METKRRFYVIPIYGCTDPEGLIGPYDTYEAMLKAAVEIWSEKHEQDAIFWLSLTVEGDEGWPSPTVGSFTSGELDRDLPLEGEDDEDDDQER